MPIISNKRFDHLIATMNRVEEGLKKVDERLEVYEALCATIVEQTQGVQLEINRLSEFVQTSPPSRQIQNKIKRLIKDYEAKRREIR